MSGLSENWGVSVFRRARFRSILYPLITAIAFATTLSGDGWAQSASSSDPLGQLRQQFGQQGALGGTTDLTGSGQNNVIIQSLPAQSGAPLPLSRLEQIMSARAGAKLEQFGYAQLGQGRNVTMAQTGAVQDDYVLGPGDQLVVSLRGQENSELRVEVNRNGEVVVPRLSPIPATGRTFGSFRQDLQAAVHRAYVATEASVAVSRVRQISVLVSGEVNVPGQRLLTGLSSVVDALLLSGGIKKTGSLRNVRVERGGNSFTVDLYSVLTGAGRSSQMRLADGDRILVPPLGRTVAVSGMVREPGVYELPANAPSISAKSLLALAGGLEVKGQYSFSVLRVSANGSFQMGHLAGDNGTIGDSEILFVQPGADQTTSQATLSGNSGLAGQYPITTGTRLSEVLKAPGALGPAPYTLFGIIARKDSRTLLRQLIPFTPVAILNGQENIALQSDDIIRVLSVNEVRLLNNTARLYVQSQIVAQENIRNPLTAPSQLATLPPVPAGPGGVPANAATPSAVAAQNAVLGGAANAPAMISDQQRDDIAGLANQVDPVTQQARDAQIAAQQQQAMQQAFLQQQTNIANGPISSAYPNQASLAGAQTPDLAASQLPNGALATAVPQPSSNNVVQTLPALNYQSTDANSGMISSNREINNFGDLARQLNVDQLVLVNFLIDHQAVLNGAVGGPGSYFVGPNVPLDVLVQAAGGTTNWADESGVELITTAIDTQSGRSSTHRTMLPLHKGTLANYVVRPHDQFRFNQVFTDVGLGSATVQGEVRFNGTYQITRGEHLSDLLARAGGLTNTAYPAGTVFLRKSAAQAEHEGYIRAAAEIQNQLVVAMTRVGNDKIDPSTFASMQAFVNELRNQQAVGRIAIAADPSVLAAAPELDPLLEPGDVVYIPQRPTTVAVLGQVMQPGNFPYRPGRTLADYLEQAGGYNAISDESLTFIVLPDGSARRVQKSWLSFDAENLPPGSTIVVPRDVTPLDTRQLILDVSSIFSQFAVSLASLAVLAKQ